VAVRTRLPALTVVITGTPNTIGGSTTAKTRYTEVAIPAKTGSLR
jgi:hypothetical protein